MELERETSAGRHDGEGSAGRAGGEPSPDVEAPAADSLAVARPGTDADWNGQRPAAIVCHILETFHDPLRQNLSELALLLDQVRTQHGDRHPALFDQLSGLFRTLKWDLLVHIEKEERVLFPLILRIDEATRTGESTLPPLALLAPISQMESAHGNVSRALGQLRDLSGNFTPPAGAAAAVHTLYRRLRELAEETQRHVRLEHDVLFPRTLALAAHRVA